MDTQTQKFYANNHKSVLDKYRSAGEGIARYFDMAFLPGSSVLDIGFGSGRDLSLLIGGGYDAKGVDPCAEFVQNVPDFYPELRGLLHEDSLPGLGTIAESSFDGVLCAAVLMHLPEEQLFDSACSIRRVLKEDGRLLISVPAGRFKKERDEKGRLFNGVTPENFQRMFERIGFRLISRQDDDDSLGRKERRWATMLFSYEAAGGERSPDKTDGVFNKDLK